MSRYIALLPLISFLKLQISRKSDSAGTKEGTRCCWVTFIICVVYSFPEAN